MEIPLAGIVEKNYSIMGCKCDYKIPEKNTLLWALWKRNDSTTRCKCDYGIPEIELDATVMSFFLFSGQEKIDDKNRPTVNKPSNKIKRDEIIQNGQQIKNQTDNRVSPHLTQMQRSNLRTLYK